MKHLLGRLRVWPRLPGVVAVLLLAAPLAAEAQPSTTAPRIGLLFDAASWEPFRVGLRDLGYVEGKTIELEERSSRGRNERFSDLAFELVRLSVNTVLWNPDAPSHAPALKAVEEAGRMLRVQLQPVVVRTAAELEGAFAAMARARAQAVLVLATAVFLAERQRVAELAIKHRLPTMSMFKDVVDAGGLMSYSPNWDDLHRRGAIYVDKILKGANPADLPVEQATKFELVINLKTAKAIGLTVPQSVLARADEIIE